MQGITLLFLLLATPLVLCQKFSFGSCGQLQSIALNNGLMTLTGDFRVHAVSPSPFFHHWNCVSITISQNIANTEFSILVQGRGKISGIQKTASGKIQVNGPIAANLVAGNSLTFSFQNSRKFTSATYYVLDGANDNYLALYACENIGFGKLEHVMILTTSMTTPAQLSSAFSFIADRGYPTHSLKRTYLSCD